MLLYLVLFHQALFFCTTMASSDLKRYDNCLCSKLFDILVDEKAKWKETNSKVFRLENKLEQSEKNVWQSPSGHSKCKYPIAFYARRDNGNTVSGTSIVDFKQVITDTCNTYDKATSLFTCPVAGVYVFNVWILDNANGKHSYLLIMKNKTAVGELWAHGNSHHETGGNTAILKLQKGDVRNGSKLHQSSLNVRFCTFSGFKLY